MRFKHNPFVSMVALALLGAILLWVCTGCGAAEAENTAPIFTEAEKSTHRFTYEYAGHSPATHGSFYIITDTYTGVQYLADGNGLAKLEG
jgi:hypothetical protein